MIVQSVTCLKAMQLEKLAEGDKIKYHGLIWDVLDYSNYDDEKGYKIEEWLVSWGEGIENYLLKEVDPENPATAVNWYLSEEIKDPKLFSAELEPLELTELWTKMQGQEMPYADLKLFGKSYFFESRTTGLYNQVEDDSKMQRITWDYWDLDHQFNLAIEAWSNGKIQVYSTRVVNPAEIVPVLGDDRSTYPKSSTSPLLKGVRMALLYAGVSCLLVGCVMFVLG